MMTFRRWLIAVGVGMSLALSIGRAEAQELNPQPGSSPARIPDNAVYRAPKVELAFNRLYDEPELVEAMRRLVAAHPDLLTMESIGKSVEGRDLWCVTIANPKTGDPKTKPAFYVDANVHGNEVQTSEACLYLTWYLTENYDRLPQIRQLVDERVFYVLPTVNPDGRAWWFNGPNTTNSSRSGKAPQDDDRDGRIDEDTYQDLDGDGQIRQMRRRSPVGRYRAASDDPRRMELAPPGEFGEYELLGFEGLDNDGDGQINEDLPGGYDMNRNYPSDWRPETVQRGAGPFPLCWPETRAVAEFIKNRPHIAGVQSFHNAGGMILRGPGHPDRASQYPAEDEQMIRGIGEEGVRLLPFYRNLVIEKDLYAVHGGFTTWTYENLGIVSFTNELWSSNELLGTAPGQAKPNDDLFAADRLLHGATFKDWTPFRHPTLGDIEIGGFVKESQRIPPPFLLEQGSHRNAAFVIFHADQMPRPEWLKVEATPLGGGVYQIDASVRNTRRIPTITAQAARHKLNLPDRLSLMGDAATILDGGELVNPDAGLTLGADSTAALDQDDLASGVRPEPRVVRFERGVPGLGAIHARWIVQAPAGSELRLRFESQKGGVLNRSLVLP